MKKVLTLILILVMVASVFSACAKDEADSSAESGSEKTASNEDAVSEENSSEETEQITLTFWRPGTDENSEIFWKELIAEFESQNPNITIELSSVPWGDEMETKLNAGYASGTGPDFIAYSVASIAQRAGLEQFMPLDSYIENWEGKDDIYENVFELGSYKEQVYGIGFSPDPRVFAWRKDYFEEAGLDPEQAPKDWEELKEFALKLTKKDGDLVVQGGFDIPVGNSYQILQIFGNQNGGTTMDVANNEPLFDSPEFIEAAEFLDDLVAQGVNVPWEQLNGIHPFEQGTVAMTYENPNLINDIIRNNPDMASKIGVGPPLERVKKGTFCGFQLMFISEETEHKNECWSFIELALSKEIMWKRYEDLGVATVRKSLEADYIAANPLVNGAVLEAIQYGESVPKVPYAAKAMEYMSHGIEEAFYDVATPKDALINAANQLREEIPNLINE